MGEPAQGPTFTRSQDWSESNNSHDDDSYVAKGPSLSYERKIRLHKYAENRARSCLGLVSDASTVLWKLHESKHDTAVFKPSSDWSEFLSAKAVVRADASFPHVLKTVYDLKTSSKFKLFLRKVLGDAFLDAEVLEDLNGTGMYSDTSPSAKAPASFKQAAIKWWAIKSGSLASKASDFYVLEYVGNESVGSDIVSCYLFQESLAEVGGMPPIMGNNLERSQFDALICKFERLPAKDYGRECVMISVAFQRPPPMVSLFRNNPATEMVSQLAKGLKELLEDPPIPNAISVVKTSAWVKDKERQYCYICVRRFSPLFRRKHHCRSCGEIICWLCSSTLRVPSISFSHTNSGRQVLSRHQPSIRVCTKCVVSHHRMKIDRDMDNQEDFKEWMQRAHSAHAHQEDPVAPMKNSADRPTEESNPNDDLNYPRSVSLSEDQLPRKYMRLSIEEEEEEKEEPQERQGRRVPRRRKQKRSQESYHNRFSQTERRSLHVVTDTPNRPSQQGAKNPPKRTNKGHAKVYGNGKKSPVDVADDGFDSLLSPGCVHAASAWATHQKEETALTGAFQELLTKLSGEVHFLVIGFSTGFNADVIIDRLRHLAPGVPYIGGTIARGMCDENAWVSVNRHNDQGLLTLWGVNDPKGVYTVAHAEYAHSDAKYKTSAATKAALTKVRSQMYYPAQPAFAATYACPLFVDRALEGIREVVSCPIVGGCSSDAARYRDGQAVASWMQISSGGANGREAHGEATEMGIAFALCFPSVETHVSWFSGYDPVRVGNEYCMGVVSKSSGKMIEEIDGRPAADVYREWLDVVSAQHGSDWKNIGFPRLGNLHPLGTTIDFASKHMDIERSHTFTSMSSLVSLQSSDWSRLINRTAVITGMHDNGSLNTTSSVAVGTNVVLMQTSGEALKQAVNRMGAQVMESRKFSLHETIGCLMFLSAGVQALLGHKSMAEMVGAYKDWSGGASMMGMTTFGEVGHLPCFNDAPHYDSLMFGAIIFSKRKRKDF